MNSTAVFLASTCVGSAAFAAYIDALSADIADRLTGLSAVSISESFKTLMKSSKRSRKMYVPAACLWASTAVAAVAAADARLDVVKSTLVVLAFVFAGAFGFAIRRFVDALTSDAG